MIAGKEKRDGGEIVIGSTVQLAIVDQTREALPNDKTVFDAISGGQDILTVGKVRDARARLSRPLQFQGR
jgi:sulfate-transporting ATPase